MRKNTKITIAIIGILLVAIFGYYFYYMSTPGKLDSFAQCLKEKGATFYGAFWCPHCQATKALFGKSQKLLPYVECSTADGKGQLQVCKDKQVTGYPTWEFSDGSRMTGEKTLGELADKTGCVLPDDADRGTPPIEVSTSSAAE